MSEIDVSHRKEDGEQITTFSVRAEGDTHAFEGAPTATSVEDVEYQGDGEAPEAAVAALKEHFKGAGADADDEA